VLSAWIVKIVEPAGVAFVVVIVNVDVFAVSFVAKFTVAGLKAAVAPDGKLEVTVRAAPNAAPGVAPFLLTVTT